MRGKIQQKYLYESEHTVQSPTIIAVRQLMIGRKRTLHRNAPGQPIFTALIR